MKIYSRNGITLEAQYLYRQGLEMMSRKMDEKALNYFRQAVFLSPRFSRACREIGECLTRLGRHEEAREYFIKTIRIDPAVTGIVVEKILSD